MTIERASAAKDRLIDTYQFPNHKSQLRSALVELILYRYGQKEDTQNGRGCRR
jgi:hypothetical protein